MSNMRRLIESLDDIIDGEAIGVEEKPVKKPKSKFLGNPHHSDDNSNVIETEDDEDDEDLTESLKAQFEDYVKNKAVPDSKKEFKLVKQNDGSYQVKNEKGSVVCRGTKSDCQTHITKKNAELNDAKLDEGKEDKIKNLKKDYADKLRWAKESHNPSEQRQLQNGANKIKNHLKSQYKVDVAEGIGDSIKRGLGEARGDTIEAHGIRGMDRKPWQRSFKSVEALNAWCEKYDAECYGTRDTDAAANGKLSPAVGVKESGGDKSNKMAKLKSILDKLSDELKNTRKQIGSSKKVTEAPIDQQVPQAAGTTVQAAPGVVQAAGQTQQPPANQQGAVPANQSQQLPKPAPGQPQTTAQQAPAQPGQKTVAPAPGQPTPPAAGQAGGAPVAQPAGTPAPPQGSAVNASTTPAEQIKGLVQTLASNPGAAKQLGTKLNTVMK